MKFPSRMHDRWKSRSLKKKYSLTLRTPPPAGSIKIPQAKFGAANRYAEDWVRMTKNQLLLTQSTKYLFHQSLFLAFSLHVHKQNARSIAAITKKNGTPWLAAADENGLSLVDADAEGCFELAWKGLFPKGDGVGIRSRVMKDNTTRKSKTTGLVDSKN